MLLVGLTVHSSLVDVFIAAMLSSSLNPIHRFIWRRAPSEPLQDYRSVSAKLKDSHSFQDTQGHWVLSGMLLWIVFISPSSPPIENVTKCALVSDIKKTFDELG